MEKLVFLCTNARVDFRRKKTGKATTGDYRMIVDSVHYGQPFLLHSLLNGGRPVLAYCSPPNHYCLIQQGSLCRCTSPTAASSVLSACLINERHSTASDFFFELINSLAGASY